MEYFSNIDKYEDLSFVGDPKPAQVPSCVVENPEQTQKQKKKDKPKIMAAQTMIYQAGTVVYDLSDDDVVCEEGASPALLGGFAIQQAFVDNPDGADEIILEREHPERLAEDLMNEDLFDRQDNDGAAQIDIGKKRRRDWSGLPTGRDSSDGEFDVGGNTKRH